VIEFQHSHLRRKERKSRENFYPKMVWVVDGRSRKRDAERFFRSLDAARVINGKPLTVSVPSDEGALLRRWVGCHSAVFFDFGDNSEPVDPPSFGGPVLWRLDPHNPRYEAHLLPVLKTSFLDTCLNGLPLRGIDYSAELSVPRLEAWIRSKWRDYPRNFWRDNTFGAILRQRQAMSV
jgi:hypothetical protein